MKKFLFSTAFASLLLLYNVDALSEGIVDNNRKNHKESIDVVEGDASKQTSLYASVGNYHRIDVGGKILSYAWVADNSKDMYDHGARLDGIFNIRSVNTNPKLGISYGANLQLAVPAVKNEGFVPSVKGYNRGAQLFIDSSYGSFSFGYQEGVESVMKVDPSMIESGDNSVTWVQCIGLSDFGKRVGYHVFPGLYSESLFNERYNESYNDSSMWIKDRDFVNNLPFRISYQSPDFMGIKFGISYSPSGYDVDLFEHVLPRDYVPKGADALQRANVGNVVLPDNATFLGGAYDNVISAALSYGYSFNNNVDFQASIAGEYASDRETFKRSYLHHLHAKDLAAFAVGTSVTYGNMVFAASYGYLGSSGYLSVYDRAKGSLKKLFTWFA
ncbi:MAG: porin [Ehrlichia sp.]